MIVDATGHVCYDADYFPFGWEQSTPVNTCAQNYKFTGKERDPNTYLDYFGARWYAGTIARFMTPDWSGSPVPVPYADLTDPQTLNLYSYVRNNPLARVDSDGHDVWDIVLGATNALTSNNVAGAGRMDASNSDFAKGQAIGDFLSVVQGGVEVLAGGGLQAGGGAACATGVGCLAGAPAAAVGTAAEVHGTATAGMGLIHLMESAGEGGSKGGAQDKKLTPGEIKNLKENTKLTPEQIKQETMGTKKVGQFDLYKNSEGQIVVKPKGSGGPGETTGYTTDHVKPPVESK